MSRNASTGSTPETATEQADSTETESTSRNADPDNTTESEGAQATLVGEHETNRWYGVTGVALVCAGVAIQTTTPALLLASAVCVGILGAVRIAPVPEPNFTVERTFSAGPSPGERVDVSVAIRNVGALVPDVRIVDCPPSAVSVVDGSPRRAGMIRSGETVRLSYTILARRGHHEFTGTTVVVRDLFGTVEREYELSTPDEMTVPPDFRPLEAAPIRTLATGYVGRLSTDTSGSGIEFYQTREYRPGDPMNRIDWNRLAKTEELATLEFRTERAVSVVIVADVRKEAFVSPGDGARSGAAVSLDAVDRLFPTFLAAGDTVGLAALGEKISWLAPGSGPAHRARGQKLLATDPSFSPTATPTTMRSILGVRDLQRRLSDNDQIVVCSPLCDDGIERIVRMLDAYGNQATVISPDMTTTDTPGHTVAAIERTQRISRLRKTGVRVVDWAPDVDLDTAIARAIPRWSR